MPYSMVAILVSIVVVAVLYAKIYPIGDGITSGIYLGVLIGIFSVLHLRYSQLRQPEHRPRANALRRHHLLHPVGDRRSGHRLHLQAIVDLSAIRWEEKAWKLRKLARNLLRRDLQSGSVERCGLIRFFKHPIPQLSQVRALRLSRVRELHGIRIRSVKL